MAEQKKQPCPDCKTDVSRREFVAAMGGAAAIAGGLPLLSSAAPTTSSAAETAAKALYESLTEDQRGQTCMDWSDGRRTNISPNWHITKANVGTFTKKQQGIIHEVVKGVCSEDGYPLFLKQMKADNGGIERYSVALCGKPGDKQFSFILTGRHLTLRADGNTTEGAAFGGPIVYGHGQSDPTKNYFFNQTQQANKLFQALDEKQRKIALLAKAPKETAVRLRADGAKLPGIPGADLSDDQKELFKKTLAEIMAPYRKEDVDEALKVV
ncbi:MAG: DUF3500 domain-containing protein, partial [Planctomycetales bacterium]